MGNKIIVGVDDLATTNPDIAREWDYEKNSPLTPQQFTRGSNKKVWWICPFGHSYATEITNRTNSRASGCAYCAGKAVLPGFNDLATTNPDIAREWDYERNGDLTPQQVVKGYSKAVFWLCPNGHSYNTKVVWRTWGGNGCAYCANQKVLAGFNDLETKFPGVAREWDYEKNSPLTPSEVLPGTNNKVHWRCARGHSFEQSPKSRTSRASGCAYCAGKAVLPGFNDLATTNPDIAREWDYERNGDLTPEKITAGSAKTVFWLCPNGHSYSYQPKGRTGRNEGCAYCANQKVLAGFNDLETKFPGVAREWDYEKNAPLTPSEVTAANHLKAYWVCPEGHAYRAAVADRTSKSSGCPKCANSGYDATKEGLFYFIANTVLQARKIGITNPNGTRNRVEAYGADWQVIKTYSHENGLVIRDLETLVLRWLRKDLGLPRYLGKVEMGFSGGHTETFSMEGPSDFEVVQKIEETLSQLLETGTLPRKPRKK